MRRLFSIEPFGYAMRMSKWINIIMYIVVGTYTKQNKNEKKEQLKTEQDYYGTKKKKTKSNSRNVSSFDSVVAFFFGEHRRLEIFSFVF